jgi:hypothetical protein
MKACANACGDCRRCRLIARALADAKRKAKLLHQAMVLLQACDFDLATELASNSASDIRSHPALRSKLGLRYRIEKLARHWAEI